MRPPRPSLPPQCCAAVSAQQADRCRPGRRGRSSASVGGTLPGRKKQGREHAGSALRSWRLVSCRAAQGHCAATAIPACGRPSRPIPRSASAAYEQAFSTAPTSPTTTATRSRCTSAAGDLDAVIARYGIHMDITPRESNLTVHVPNPWPHGLERGCAVPAAVAIADMIDSCEPRADTAARQLALALLAGTPTRGKAGDDARPDCTGYQPASRPRVESGDRARACGTGGLVRRRRADGRRP